MAIEPASEQIGLYYAQQFSFSNGLTGYTGLQPQQTSGGLQQFRATFSVFASGAAGTPGNTSSSDPNCSPGADSGAGQSCSVLFTGEYGHAYHLKVRPTGSTSTTNTWTGDVFDPATSHLLVHIGSWTLPSGLLKSSGSGFVEYVYFDAHASCERNTVSDVLFGNPTTVDGGGLSGTLSNIAEYGSCAGASFATAPAGAGAHIVRGFTTTSAFTGRSSGRCLNAPSAASGAQTDIESCNGTDSQYWTFTPNTLGNTHSPVPSSPLVPNGGSIRGFLHLGLYGWDTSMCLDNNSQTTPGGKVIVWPCAADNPHQQWTLNPNGSIQSTDSWLCLDTASGGTADATLVVQATCNGTAGQRWTRGANP
ncbi:RICIN domain-containing protein [Kitasatospora sp. NPDC059646]|uniref:RICIN domain-containing protein n=1 Tax=Kitasatospora sp. NPDC059646 TaxID=3346893 RepID=UPI00368C2C2C